MLEKPHTFIQPTAPDKPAKERDRMREGERERTKSGMLTHFPSSTRHCDLTRTQYTSGFLSNMFFAGASLAQTDAKIHFKSLVDPVQCPTRNYVLFPCQRPKQLEYAPKIPNNFSSHQLQMKMLSLILSVVFFKYY